MVRALPGHAPCRSGEKSFGEISLGKSRINWAPGRRSSLVAMRRMLRAIRIVHHTTIMTPATAALYCILATSTCQRRP